MKETSKKTKSLKKRNITALCILVLMVVFLLIFPTQTGIFENNTVNENDGYTIAEHNETEIDEQSYLDIGADSDNAQNESNENQNGYAKDDLSNDLADPNDHLYDDEAYENQDYPFESLAQHFEPTAHLDKSRTPLYDVQYLFYKDELEVLGEIEVGGLRFESEEIVFTDESAKFDLVCKVTEHGGVYTVTFKYCTDLFKRETIESMVNQFIEVLERFTEDLSQTIKDLT